MYILGIDGGGTHTRTEHRDLHNSSIRRREYGSINLSAIGEEAFRLQLREIFGDLSDCAALCLGMAGISVPAAREILQQELTRAGFTGKLLLRGDHEIALAGAIDGPGAILIAGTGSICCGRDPSGNFFRRGGLGHLLDDEGSGYAIGLAAASLAARTADGRINPNGLQEAILSKIQAEGLPQLLEYVYGNPGKKDHIAALAPTVIGCAQAGEPSSLRILQSQADALADVARSLCGCLAVPSPTIALMGGLLDQNNLYRELVAARLQEFSVPVRPAHDALWGAAQIAYRSI